MPIYRRGPVYVVSPSVDRAFRFDSRDGTCGGWTTLARACRDAPKEYKPVLESEYIPEALARLLVLKFPEK